jgi:hypothetical protein
MFCTYCGTQLPPTSVFCHVCGAKAVLPTEGGPQPSESAEAQEAPPEEEAPAPEPIPPEPETGEMLTDQFVLAADLRPRPLTPPAAEEAAQAADAAAQEPETWGEATEQFVLGPDLGAPPAPSPAFEPPPVRPPVYEAPPFRARAAPGWAAVPRMRPAQDIAGLVVGVIAIAGAVLAVIGAFLPWVDRGFDTWNGFQAGYLTDPLGGEGVDGLAFLIVGLAAAGIALHYFFVRNAWASFGVVILGIAIYCLGVYDLVRLVHDARIKLDMSTRDALDLIGVGLYLCIAGGVVTSLAAMAGTWRAVRRGPL